MTNEFKKWIREEVLFTGLCFICNQPIDTSGKLKCKLCKWELKDD